jgi:hypothetical protein
MFQSQFTTGLHESDMSYRAKYSTVAILIAATMLLSCSETANEKSAEPKAGAPDAAAWQKETPLVCNNQADKKELTGNERAAFLVACAKRRDCRFKGKEKKLADAELKEFIRSCAKEGG